MFKIQNDKNYSLEFQQHKNRGHSLWHRSIFCTQRRAQLIPILSNFLLKKGDFEVTVFCCLTRFVSVPDEMVSLTDRLKNVHQYLTDALYFTMYRQKLIQVRKC